MVFTLPQKTKLLWQVQAAFAIAFLCFVILLLPLSHWTRVLVLFTVTGIGFAFVLIYIPWYLKNYEIRVDDGCIIVKSGILFKKTVIVLFVNISTAKCITGPFISILGLKIIVFKTSRATFVIAPIDKADVRRILKKIYGGKDDI